MEDQGQKEIVDTSTSAVAFMSGGSDPRGEPKRLYVDLRYWRLQVR